MNFKYRKPYYFIINQKEASLRQTQLFSDLFPNLTDSVRTPKPTEASKNMRSIFMRTVKPGGEDMRTVEASTDEKLQKYKTLVQNSKEEWTIGLTE